MRPVIVDVDSHFQEPVTWLVDSDPALAASIPGTVLLGGMAAFAGQDIQALPPTPFWEALQHWAPESTLADAEHLVDDPATRPLFGAMPFDSSERLRWLDQAGIDHQFCHPTIGAILWSGASSTDGTRSAVAREYNRWAVAASANTAGRLHASVLMEPTDLAWSCAELKWAASQGCRTVILPIDVNLWSRLMASEADRFWSIVEETDMTAVLHVGVVDGDDAAANVLGHWVDVPLQAQRCLARWATSPAASKGRGRILVEELGVDWALPWMRNLRRAEAAEVVRHLGGEREHSAGELLERIVWSVLPRDTVSEVIASGERITLAFGSDHPHQEGWTGDDPVGAFRARIGDYEHVARWSGLDPVITAHAAAATSHASG